MSLRNKQALILLIATVLPFALGAGAVALVVAPAYRRAVSSVSVEGSQRLADYVAWNLARNVSRLERLAAWDEVRALAWSSNYLNEKGELQRRPPSLKPGGPQPLLENPVSREFAWLRRSDVAVTELLATDLHGRVIAATGKPAALLQADQGWWQQAYAGGSGRVSISETPLTGGSPARGLSVAVPVFADASPGSRVTGIVRMVLDVDQTFPEVRQARPGYSGEAMLVNQRGEVLIDPNQAGPAQHLSNEDLRRVRSGTAGVFVRPTEGDEALFAWAQVSVQATEDLRGARIPRFYVLTHKSTAEAFGPLRTVHQWMLGIGLVTIAAAVALGYWLAEVLVVRQIRTLARGMRELAKGDFERAAALARRLTERAR